MPGASVYICIVYAYVLLVYIKSCQKLFEFGFFSHTCLST